MRAPAGSDFWYPVLPCPVLSCCVVSCLVVITYLLFYLQHVFPGVPIEMIVSLGTGCFFEEKKEFLEPADLGWDGIINQVNKERSTGTTAVRFSRVSTEFP